MKQMKMLFFFSLCGGMFAGENGISATSPHTSSPDFQVRMGFSYEAHNTKGEYGWKNRENNQFSSSILIGMEKKIAAGIIFGFEAAGWSNMGLEIANGPVIPDSVEGSDVDFDRSSAEISQAYLDYLLANTEFKAGRMALSSTFSPWLWSDRSAWVIDMSYEGALIKNNDLSNTSLTGAWIKNAYISSHFGGISLGNDGLFMIGLRNKSFADTILNLNAYYLPENKMLILLGSPETAKSWSLWGNVEKEREKFVAAFQIAYADGDITAWNPTLAIAAKAKTEWGDICAETIAAYINNGDYSLMGAGSGLGSSAFWSDHEFDGDTVGERQFIGIFNFGYRIGIGALNASIAYWNYENVHYRYAWAAVAGYEWAIGNLEGLAEFAVKQRDFAGGGSEKDQRITIEASYRF